MTYHVPWFIIVQVYLCTVVKLVYTMSETSGNSMHTTKFASDIKITVEDTEELDDTITSTAVSTSFCIGSDELHKDYLQVPNSPKSLDDTKDGNGNNEIKRSSLRGSITNLAAEVFTTQNITKVVKVQLMIVLFVTICLMILLFVAPIIWYNINLSSAASCHDMQNSVIDDVNFESCSVSFRVCIYVHKWLFYMKLTTYYSGTPVIRTPWDQEWSS